MSVLISDASLLLALHLSILIAVILRVLLREHREPASRIAWIAVVCAVPIGGIVAYLFLGEVNLGRHRKHRLRQLSSALSSRGAVPENPNPSMQVIPRDYQPSFAVGQSISGFAPVTGNQATLMSDSNVTIDTMVADIDAAKHHVHLIFYIWLADRNGSKIVEALQRAAKRGVRCRAMADGLGSRGIINSVHWKSMRDAGVQLSIALPINRPLLRAFFRRIDLRNHRKLLVIDSRIAYCGSQNCADPEFLIKPKYAPWVDIVLRFEGPIAQQNQWLFAYDWMTSVNEDLHALLVSPVPSQEGGFPAQVVATGPDVRCSAMPEMFVSLIYSARDELVISTPYFVPTESLQAALCSAAYRGVDTKIVFPARNDSRIVAAASRSYYADLLAAGVKIHEYSGGLLHAKTLTIDGAVSMIGSANMDRRSFELNYENNVLLADDEMTGQIRQRQQTYLDSSTQVTSQEVAQWSFSRRIWNNTIAMLGPVL
ncbi:cardiolipin synthase [Stieleria sp. TO1_6]|uniref:cardiolipin synthase n=1 Tax=Stieleria tagensis TaxID=2956795 RepID=UPI00209B3EFB|nr:cardiolipin synthase [Stieleria tagensis]MCO8120605.1 cardiolipin synthase [Stieleria tagensis]